MSAAKALAAKLDGRLVLDAPDVAAALEMSVWALYDSVKRGDCPITPIRVGRRLKWRSSDLACLLGIEAA